MSFVEAWTLPIGTPVIVSDGTIEPIDRASVAWAAWRSHNFSGELVDKIDGDPRHLCISFEVNEQVTVQYDVSEAIPHAIRELFDELTEAKLAKRASITRVRDEHITAGAQTPLGVMDCDEVSISKVNGATLMAVIAKGAGAPFSIDWTMQDNSVVAHDADQMIAAGLAVGQHVGTCHAIATSLKEAAEAATTVAEVEAIAWPS